jgi:hypothetical protein
MKTETRYDSKAGNLEFLIRAENSAEEALIAAMKDRNIQPELVPDKIDKILPEITWPNDWIRFALKIAKEQPNAPK